MQTRVCAPAAIPTKNAGLNIGKETEKLEKYHEGGFCPIHLGECVADRFTVLHKLGHGGFGTVWLVLDTENRRVSHLTLFRY
jgi:hypothetical protein